MAPRPATVAFYKRTPDFTEQSVPAGLLKNHSTMQGVWATIVILEGVLEFAVGDEPPRILEVGSHPVIEPQIEHRVKPLGPTRFYVEFYK